MTTLHTVPIPHPLPIPRQTAYAHEHSWLVDSRHPTSEGVVLYVRCGGCGTHRVDLQAHPQAPPKALSRETSD